MGMVPDGGTRVHWLILPYQRMLDFRGRSCRMEYWMFQLTLLLLAALIFALIIVFAPKSGDPMPWSSPIILLLTALSIVALVSWLWAGLLVTIRRFHDQDRSGWFILVGAIPYVGGLITIAFMCVPGTVGPNRFGMDPRNPNMSDVFG